MFGAEESFGLKRVKEILRKAGDQGISHINVSALNYFPPTCCEVPEGETCRQHKQLQIFY
jgi:hypothetical protein